MSGFKAYQKVSPSLRDAQLYTNHTRIQVPHVAISTLTRTGIKPQP